MFIQLSRHWWWLALRGIATMLFGIIALGWRGDTLGSFMLLFGGFALVDGLLAIFIALTNVAGNKRWWILLRGSTSVVLAAFTFIWTETTAAILLYLVATWALITGILQLVGAKKLDRDVSNERLARGSGLASIIFAVLVFFLPKMGVLSIAQMTATFAVLLGLLTLAFSLNIRSMGKLARSVNNP